MVFNMNDIELCSKCADDGGTLANMQSIIIPALLKKIEDGKWIIKELHQDKQIVKDWRDVIVTNTRAIRAFYQRFPHLPRVQLRDDLKIPPREKKPMFAPTFAERERIVKICRWSREINEYATILRSCDYNSDNALVEKIVGHINHAHAELKKINTVEKKS